MSSNGLANYEQYMGTDWLNINSTWIQVIGPRIFSWILQLAQNVLHMETCVVGSIEQHMDRTCDWLFDLFVVTCDWPICMVCGSL
jgi:hypothetical protein